MSKEPIKLLVVEDDPNLGQILTEYLEIKGYAPVLCKDGEVGFETFREGKFDFCILDIMLPKKDGFSLAKEIRAIDKNVPIVFLTAKSLKEDTIQGLQIGADDYITKPFSMEELILRMTAILRRTQSNSPEAELKLLSFGKFQLEPNQQILKSPTETHRLTSKENDLLKLLCLNANQILDRSVALKLIWKDDSYFNARSMDVYIAKLRKLLKEDDSVKILTIHGQGFKLVVNEKKSDS